jgi:hypothetical protein
VRRIVGVRLEGSSGGAAGAELREALAQRAAQQHRATGRS